MKTIVPGIDVDFWKGAKRSSPDEADRAYVTGHGIFLTFSASPAGRKNLMQVLKLLDFAFDAGRKRAKEDLHKWLAD